jgi:hypothetical protein
MACCYQEILKQVQDDSGWTFYKGGTFRFAINKDTIPRSEILNQVQDDEDKRTTMPYHTTI